jgi:hypothetical protein
MSHHIAQNKPSAIFSFICLFAIMAFATACTPTVKVAPPDKPIEINLNVKIQQEVRVKVERDLENTFVSNPALFGVPTAPPSPSR